MGFEPPPSPPLARGTHREVRGLVARFLAPSPLHPRGVVDLTPDTQIKQKPRTLTGARLLLKGSFEGVELTGTLPSFFAALKMKTLIYQCFYFAKTAKNAIFGSLPLRSAYNSDKLRFNAWFILFVT